MFNPPGGQAVKAVIVSCTEGGHDVVHLLAVRLQRLPLGNQVRVLPNLVQPGMLKISLALNRRTDIFNNFYSEEWRPVSGPL